MRQTVAGERNDRFLPCCVAHQAKRMTHQKTGFHRRKFGPPANIASWQRTNVPVFLCAGDSNRHARQTRVGLWVDVCVANLMFETCWGPPRLVWLWLPNDFLGNNLLGVNLALLWCIEAFRFFWGFQFPRRTCSEYGGLRSNFSLLLQQCYRSFSPLFAAEKPAGQSPEKPAGRSLHYVSHHKPSCTKRKYMSKIKYVYCITENNSYGNLKSVECLLATTALLLMCCPRANKHVHSRFKSHGDIIWT